MRLLVSRGITFPALTDLLRELYVNVAEYDFVLPGKEQTDSRVSLLTGIHRKEVRRLRGAGAPISAVPATVSRTSRIVARWLADPAYTDAQGQPLPLPRTGEAGRPSFEALVAGGDAGTCASRRARRMARPRPRLRGRPGPHRHLRGGLPAAGGQRCRAQLYYFGRNLHDHLAAAAANILSPKPRFLERAVHYDGLSENWPRRWKARRANWPWRP